MSKKLVIRINNLQDNESSDDYEALEESSIRWDRVITVSVCAVLLLISVIWGTLHFLSSSSSDKPSFDPLLAEQEVTSEELIEEVPAVESEIAITDIVTPAPKAIIESKSAVVSESTVPSTPAKDSKPLVVSELAATSKVVTVDKVEVIETVDVIEKVDVVEDVKKISEVKVEYKEKPVANAVFSDPISIESAHMVRAQLTYNLKKGNPVERLGDVISMNDDALIKLYLFTDMAGLKGETLYHDWYLADKRMARVKINVRSNSVSASSSKFIDKHMTGDWRVKVTNSKGDALVSAVFNVSR